MTRKQSISVLLSVFALTSGVLHADEAEHSGDSVKDDFWVEIAAFMPVPEPKARQVLAPEDKAVLGEWSDLIAWPHVPVSAALLPDGRILTWASNEKRTFPRGPEFTHAAVWNPATGEFTTVNNTVHDMFCAATIMLEDGRVMAPGGRNTVKTTSVFDFKTNQWQKIDDMVNTRWYPTATMLGDGDVVIASGTGTGKDTVERWAPNAGWTRLTGVNWAGIANASGFESNWWPYNFLAPNGKVFHAGPTDAMHWLDPNGAGTLNSAGTTVPGTSYPKTGCSTMYQEGKLLIAGGATSTSGGVTDSVYTVDLNGATPVVKSVASMNHARRFSNAVPLPNGDVMIVGGNQSGIKFSDSQTVYETEIWNPASDTWSVAADIAVPRNYHSVALLLPDGRVYSAGGGLSGNSADHLDAQIYTPPTLFKADGTLAARPEITSAPEEIGYNVAMPVEATPGLAGFSLVRMVSTTHGLATGSRFVSAESFTESSPGNYAVTTHSNSNVVTPGYWMLFALDQNGVHSEAAIIKFSADAALPPVGDIKMTSVPAGIQQSGNEVSFNLEVTGGIAPVFTWDFGDGSDPVTTSSTEVPHTFATAGRYQVSVTARNADGSGEVTQSFVQIVHSEMTSGKPRHSRTVLIHDGKIWCANPDNNTVAVIDELTGNVLAEIPVGTQPVCVAAAEGEIWVVNKRGYSISVIDADSHQVSAEIPLPRGARPHGMVIDREGRKAFVTMEAIGKLARIDISGRNVEAMLDLGGNIRDLSISADDSLLLVSRFITPPVPSENTATPLTETGDRKYGGEVVKVDVLNFSKMETIVLAHSNEPDASDAGRGIPNFLGPAVISPDGTTAWIPSKQDNIKRGVGRDGNGLTHDNTVRSIVSRVDLATSSEVPDARIDFDNSGIATSAAFGPFGAHLFVTLESSHRVSVVDPYSNSEIYKIDAGFTPRGVVVSDDGKRLIVHNFLDRSLSVFDVEKLIHHGQPEVETVSTVSTVSTEALSPNVLAGKKLFYGSRDNRLALQEYISCASCHEDGEHDGRVWDLTGFGEGFRNTISLRGRAGTGHGPLHWTANFDEVQDFEGQIRNLSGGLGLMSDSHFTATSDPLGNPKSGLSDDLDALAAYLESLNEFDPSPFRPGPGTLSAEAEVGKELFYSNRCADCHGGANFSDSAPGIKHDIGTNPDFQLDTPTLRDVWATAPYLHDGSASTLEESIKAHASISMTDSERSSLAAYLREIDGAEPEPDVGVTFDQWQTNTQGAGSTPDSNGDGDQFTDLMEYALGFDPSSGVVPQNAITVSPSGASITKPADRFGLEYVLEISPDLDSWSQLSSPAVTVNGDGTETLDFAGLQNLPGMGDGVGFARLRVLSGSDSALSPVYGWVQHEIKKGHQSFGITLLKPAVIAANLVSASGSTLTLSDNSAASLLDPAQSYYAEIVSGSHEGHRFQLDSTNSNGAQMAVDFAAKTSTLSAIPNGLNGSQVVIRPHMTLGEVFPKDLFQGGSKSSLADRVMFYGAEGYESYFLLKYGDTYDFWLKNGDSSLTSQQNLPIPPGEGGFIIRRGDDISILVSGEVRGNAFIQPLRPGYNLKSEPTPVSRSAVDRGLTLQAGFQGGSKASNSDQFTIWKGDITPGEKGFTLYYLLNFNQYQYWTESGQSSLPNEGIVPHFDFRKARFILPAANTYPNYRIEPGWDQE